MTPVLDHPSQVVKQQRGIVPKHDPTPEQQEYNSARTEYVGMTGRDATPEQVINWIKVKTLKRIATAMEVTVGFYNNKAKDELAKEVPKSEGPKPMKII